MGKRGDKPRETPAAAQAFRDYVLMGPSRSLDGLLAGYLERPRSAPGAPPTRRIETLKDWSAAHRWQGRLSAAITAETEALLAEAAEIDARSFRATSEVIAERLAWADAGHIDAVIRMRESVRRPAPKGAAINVNVSVEIRELAARMAKDAGLDPATVVAEAESILGGRG